MQEKTLTGGRSYYLDIARTIAIISISLNHAVNRTYDNYFGQMEEFLESSYLSSLLKSVVTVFSHLGVPLFLMISGALLLHKRMETADDVKRFYRHNLLELFITAEIWYFIMYWFIFFEDISTGYWEEGLAGTLLGCLIIGIIGNILNLVGVNSYYQLIVKGIVIVAAIYIDIAKNRLVVKKSKR